MPTIGSGAWTLNYLDEGEGPPVLLVHGLAGDHRAWRPQIEALVPHYHVIAPDNPGSGGSGLVPEPTDLKAIATTFLHLADSLGLDRFHVVGRSMGGAIAQEMALAEPQRIASLTMAGSFARLDALGFRLIENMRDTIRLDPDWRRWTRLFSPSFVSPAFFTADAERLARLEAVIADDRRDVASYINLANACLASDTIGRLRDVACPILVMAGRLDPICSPTTTRWLADEARSAETVFFEESSHFFLMEEAEKANEVVLDWLGRKGLHARRSGEA